VDEVPRHGDGARSGELLELEARLERLKIGIGGAVITITVAPAGSPDRAEAERRIDALTADAVAVRRRIIALRAGAPPRPPDPPVEADVDVRPAGEWPPPPGGRTVVVASADHVNVYEVPASGPRRPAGGDATVLQRGRSPARPDP
jgi:hypothetical protein